MVNPAATSRLVGMPPRPVPEGSIPLLTLAGSAADCGRQYAETVLERYPGYHRYLNAEYYSQILTPNFIRLAEDRAPYLLELLTGVFQISQRFKASVPPLPTAPAGCSAFGLAGPVTLDGQPISGQTKDTAVANALQYIVLRIQLQNAPTILVLGYPGEILGHGFWSTGTSIFRNSLYSRADSQRGLTMEQWGLLTLAGTSVHAAAELAQTHGLQGAGNCLITDRDGESLSVEFNAGGVNIIPSDQGISTHTNHPLGPGTAAFEDWGHDPSGAGDSRRRRQRLHELLGAERGRLTAPRALLCLADHQDFPHGICRHPPDLLQTTAAVVVEPTRGRLHVVRSNPCSNWPVTYCI